MLICRSSFGGSLYRLVTTRSVLINDLISVQYPAYSLSLTHTQADREQQKLKSCSYKCSAIIQYVPFANFAYFTFFDDDKGPPPSREDVNALVNTIALISALLYTIGAAIPMSVGLDELEFWDWQYSVTGR